MEKCDFLYLHQSTQIFLTVKPFSCRAKSLLTVCEGEVVVAIGGEGEVVVVGRTNKQGDVNQLDFGRQALGGIGSLDKDKLDRGPKKKIFSESETLQDEW